MTQSCLTTCKVWVSAIVSIEVLMERLCQRNCRAWPSESPSIKRSIEWPCPASWKSWLWETRTVKISMELSFRSVLKPSHACLQSWVYNEWWLSTRTRKPGFGKKKSAWILQKVINKFLAWYNAAIDVILAGCNWPDSSFLCPAAVWCLDCCITRICIDPPWGNALAEYGALQSPCCGLVCCYDAKTSQQR